METSNEIIAPDGMRRCYECKLIKPLDQFNRNKGHKHGRRYLCKDCARMSARLYKHHYPRVKYPPILVGPNDKKTCVQCGEEKNYTEFSKDSNRRDGYRSNCKDCARIAKKLWLEKKANGIVASEVSATPAHIPRPPTPMAKISRNKKGPLLGGIITKKQYDKVLAQQNGVCAICGQSETLMRDGEIQRLSVDHCHETGKFRGLLCHRCNVSIGLLDEDIQIFTSAIAYLQKFKKSKR